MSGHQLYAKIKKSSKYYYQNQWAKEHGGLPFPVELHPDLVLEGTKVRDSYALSGGPGGAYCLRDVNLFVKRTDGKFVRIT